jgi:hypothetical protein
VTLRTFFGTSVTLFHVTGGHLISFVHGLPCSIGTRLTNAQQHHVPMSYAEFHLHRTNKCGIYGRELVYLTKKSTALIAPMFMPNFCGHLQYGILSKSNNAANRGEISLMPLSKDGFHWADFQGTHSWWTAIMWRSPIPNFTDICHAIRKVRTDIVYPSAKHAFTKHTRIFTTLSIARQLLVKNVYTEFHENPTNGVVADTR